MTTATLEQPAVVGPLSKRVRRGWLLELIGMIAIYRLYDFGRDQATGTTASAFRNAKDIVAAQKFFGIYWEKPIQQAFLSADWFIAFWNIYYGTIHFILPVVALVVMYRKTPAPLVGVAGSASSGSIGRRREAPPPPGAVGQAAAPGRGRQSRPCRSRYVRWRNALVLMFAIAVATFFAYPLMPPRLMPARYGFVDTAAEYYNFGPQVKVEYGRDGQPTQKALDQYGNPFAAMPSFHVGWSTWSVLALWPLVRRRWLRALLVLYALTVLFCITVTANHWLLDAVGGWVVLGLGYAGALGIEAITTWRRGRVEGQSAKA